MDRAKFRLTAGLLLALSLLNTCRCQQGALFNQSPFQRRQQSLLRQQQQQQQQAAFPNTLSPFAPLSPPALGGPLNQISALGAQSPFRQYGQLNAYNQLQPPNFIPITAYQNELNYDGSFAYGYSSADGTTAQAQGFVKNLGLGEAVEAQVVQGSYSYTSPEGTPITVRYIADENGFRAEGAHIPTPPPIPEAIAKSLQYSQGQQQQSRVGLQQSLQSPFQAQGGLGLGVGVNPNLNPYQTPFRQFGSPGRFGQPLDQRQLTPLQLQQSRFYQQQSAANQFNQQQQQRLFGGSNVSGQQLGGSFEQQQQQRQLQDQSQQQQQNLTAQRQQNLLNQQQNQQQQPQTTQQQQQANNSQQLATQQLQGRPSQLVGPFGFNQYRRYKKATKA